MDYQAELDQKKIAIRGSRWWEILWDKLGIAILVVVLGGLATLPINWYTEAYKLAESRKRFILEKRLEALTAVAATTSNVTHVFFRDTLPRQALPPDKATAEYTAALDNAREALNKNLPVLGQDFDADVSRYHQVHKAFRDVGVTSCGKYRDWASDLDTQFNAMCQAYLEADTIPSGKRMTYLKPIGFAERNKMTPQEYLDAQEAYWKNVKAAR